MQLSIPNKPLRQQKKINVTFRNTSLLNKDNFINYLQQELTLFPRITNLNDKVDHLVKIITTTLNKHAPIQTKSKVLNNKLYQDKSITEAKKEKRRAERKYLKTKDDYDKHKLNLARRKLTKLVKEMNNKFYNDKFTEASGNPRKTYKIINRLFNKSQEKKIPEHNNLSQLTQQF